MAQAGRSLDQMFLTGLVAAVAARLEQPTDALPSVRCLARPALVDILLAAREELAIPGHKLVTATTLLKVLQDAGIAHVVPLQDRAKDVRPDRLYAIGFGGTRTDLDPVELMQAHEPDGVVCYFSALALHGLTTQLPAHQHIARLVRAVNASDAPTATLVPEPTAAERSVRASALPTASAEPKPVPALGSKAFSYQGIPYYTTRREANRVLGVQSRYINEKSRYRVTTLEQTLVDTLHRPNSCGGPAVVFEAWGAAGDQVDGPRLAALVRDIGDAQLARRVGYMLSQFAPALVELVRNVVPASWAATGRDVIPLLAGIPQTSIDANWAVGVP
jgi:hypothetical protein